MKKLIKKIKGSINPYAKCKPCNQIYQNYKKYNYISLMITIILITLIFLSPILTYSFDKVTHLQFDAISKNYESDPIVEGIVKMCGTKEEGLEQISCSYAVVNMFYRFVEQPILEFNGINSPEKIIREGGVCRDYTIFYQSIYNSLGYETEMVLSKSHVGLEIYHDGNIYQLDQGQYGNYITRNGVDIS